MAKSTIEVPDIGTVHITKKRGQTSLRLRVDTKGQVQVSMPWLVPRGTALNFIASKQQWIKQQQAEQHLIPYNGMLFGKTLRLIIMQHNQTIRSKQTGKNVIVYFAGAYNPNNQLHIDKIKKAMMKALRLEAEQVLLPRLQELAQMYNFEYKSSGVKQVVGRWGSCDSHKHISLSLFLIQLPIEQIDYVLIHELTHTLHMNHSPEFWQHLAKYVPDYKKLRAKMRGMQPRIYDAKTFMS